MEAPRISFKIVTTICILVLLAVGIFIGWNAKPDPEVDTHLKELQKERIERSKERDSLNDVIDGALYLRSLDSIVINDLRQSIKEDGVKTKKLIKELEKLTPDEKVDMLFNRYNYKP